MANRSSSRNRTSPLGHVEAALPSQRAMLAGKFARSTMKFNEVPMFGGFHTVPWSGLLNRAGRHSLRGSDVPRHIIVLSSTDVLQLWHAVAGSLKRP